MQEITQLNDRGSLTLPASIRKALGLKGKQPVLLEVTDDGAVTVRPVLVMPVELYSDEKIKEFERQDKELGKLLDQYGM